MELEIYRQVLEKYSNLMKISPVGPSCSMLADRHDEANSRFLRFCVSAGPTVPLHQQVHSVLSNYAQVQLYFTNTSMTHTVLDRPRHSNLGRVIVAHNCFATLPCL